MAINGIRFAVDNETQLQYILKFENDELVEMQLIPTHPASRDASAVAQKGFFVAYDDEPQTATDDEGNKMQMRPVYTIEFTTTQTGVRLIDLDISAEDASVPLPQQHKGNRADIARQLYNMGQVLLVKVTNANPRTDTKPAQPAQNDNTKDNSKDMTLKDILEGSIKGNGTGTKQPKPGTVKDPNKPGMRVPGPGVRFSVPDGTIDQNMKKYGKDLTQLAKEGALDPVIGRDKEASDVMQLLLRKKRSNVLLLGEAGVGKTAIAEGVAQMIADGKAPAELADARIISLDLQAMNAGSQLRGSFEERLLPILKGLDERGGYLKGQKVIIFIDELHAALGAGQAMGAKGAGEIMKPYLSGGNFTSIGATTPEEFKKHIEKDKAMVRRFQPYEINEPKTEHTLEIMKGVAKTYAEYHNLDVPFDNHTLEYVVRMTDRFMPNQQQPDKSIGIIDDAAAIARAEGRKEVTQTDITHAVSKATGLKDDFLNQDDLDRYLKLEELLEEKVKGQPAVKEIAEALISSRVGLSDEDAPRGSFLLAGPTGVGKTETAKAINEILNGDGEITRINMGEFQEKHTVSKLIGSPPGYVGFDNNNSAQLTDPVRNKPFSVILIDEIEKAHPDVMNIFLSILDDGEAKDGQGRNVDFRNTIFVFTTNLGAKEVQAQLNGGAISFGSEDQNDNEKAEEDHKKVHGITMRAIKKHLRPEMVNRFDGVYTYFQLEKEAIATILEGRLKAVEKSLIESANGLQLQNATLEISDDVKAALAEKGYDKAFGARPLKRAIKKHLTNDLGKWIMKNRKKLMERDAKGPFKIVVNGIGSKFKPKLVDVKTTAAKTANSTDKSTDGQTPEPKAAVKKAPPTVK